MITRNKIREARSEMTLTQTGDKYDFDIDTDFEAKKYYELVDGEYVEIDEYDLPSYAEPVEVEEVPEERAKDARPEWLDKLSGSSELRQALADPAALDALLSRWREDCKSYSLQERMDLYCHHSNNS